MTLTLDIFDDNQWADRVAARWSALMLRNPNARLCLPTGETPRPVYASVAPVTDFSSASVFVLDEFDLPRGDAARCDSMMQRDFLSLLIDPPSSVDALHPEAPVPEAECRRFDSLVTDGGLALTLLGLGGNGHLGLNEPGTAIDAPTRVVELAPATTRAAGRYGPGAAPKSGMTLGMRPILESREIWLLVTGAHKAGILDRFLNGPVGPDVPATFLREHPNATVFADRSAMGELT